MRNGNFDELLKTHRDKVGSIILDSGTWTLNNSKGPVTHITLEGYKRYLQKFEEMFDAYFNYDSDFTEKGFGINLENQLTLERVGLRPIPVIHDVKGDEVQYYLENKAKYPYVAIGSNQKDKGPALRQLVQTYYENGTRVHILGDAKYKSLANIPVYACDSSNWAMTGAYGDIRYWNDKKAGGDKTDKIYLGKYIGSPKKGKSIDEYEYREDLLKYLKDTFEFTRRDLTDTINIQIVNLHYYNELERIVNEKHEAKRIKFE
jgi:hypothetical protein